MIDKEELRSFLVFLDTASLQELSEREIHQRRALEVLPRGDLRRDVQFLHRKLLEERYARLNLRWVQETRKARKG